MTPSQSAPSSALSEFRPVLIVTALFSCLINLLMFVSPLYMLQVYDRVLSSHNAGTLVALTTIAVFLLLTYAVLDILRSRVLVRAGARFDEVLAKPLFQQMLKVALARRTTSPASVLRDVDTVRECLTGSVMLTLFDVPFVPLFVAVCFLFHPWLGVVATAGGVVLFALAVLNERMTRKGLTASSKASGEANYYATSSVRNVEVIHALGMQDAIYGRWQSLHGDVLGWQALASDRAGILLSSTKFVRQVLQIAILGTGALLAIERQISPGMMVAASIMMGRALAPIEQSVGQWKSLMNAFAAWRRLNGIFQVQTPHNVPERTPLPAPEGALDVQDVVVALPDHKEPILKAVSFRAAKGEVIAVIGPSGAGKSTLARALVGVQPLNKGAVRLDGSDITHWDPVALGQHLGYLPQSVELFAGTIAENISRFSAGASPSLLLSAAEMAGVHQFIQSLPHGYDTEIGENGGSLSGGQRQRVALARALYGNPKFVVLDEPNSNLDSDGERELMNVLARCKADKTTVVIITHRPNLLSIADKTLLLAGGAVRAYGPTQEVLQHVSGAKVVEKVPPTDFPRRTKSIA